MFLTARMRITNSQQNWRIRTNSRFFGSVSLGPQPKSQNTNFERIKTQLVLFDEEGTRIQDLHQLSLLCCLSCKGTETETLWHRIASNCSFIRPSTTSESCLIVLRTRSVWIQNSSGVRILRGTGFRVHHATVRPGRRSMETPKRSTPQARRRRALTHPPRTTL
jgi:hypothetical protein